ncbi:MalY/PatB family protein [Clostridium brassicae]|uniref:cysteine-S-conjugate beta-lyase n=1 Tax=Clostridium brassicae TaxID=2999072 RepID=A0ABT4DC82_9CLOT|nr:MalY/PatB family protein [Clostridium brassicae]MCY6959921.1 pyridoxal phosphate-dependent aminotransferase [Clostridium brassicae]
MIYDFDKISYREGTNCAKYDERIKKFGTDDVIPLWIADMDFATAKPITDAIKARAEQEIFGYVSRPDEYFDSLCRWQKKRNNWDIDKELLSFSVGVVPALAALIRQLSEIGDEILIQTPVYPEFYDIVEAADRKVLASRLVEKDGAWSIDYTDFENKLKRHPKAFILCNPQNPTGHPWSREELTKMGELCIKYGVTVISDEIHADLMLWGNKHIPMASISREFAANTITCTAISKTFNLAGLQAASVIFNNQEEKAKFEKLWHSLEIHRNNSFSLVASIAAYNEGEEWLEQLLKYLEDNMKFIHSYCKKYIPKIKPNIPECTYLVWIDCRELGLTDEELNEFMIKKAKIGLNAGNGFDRDLTGFMRLNAACPRSILEKALDQLKDAVNNL